MVVDGEVDVVGEIEFGLVVPDGFQIFDVEVMCVVFEGWFGEVDVLVFLDEGDEGEQHVHYRDVVVYFEEDVYIFLDVEDYIFEQIL